MAHLREAGFIVVKVEHRDRTGITHDFAGFADLIAYKAGRPIIAVQATTTGHLNERERKIRGEPRAKEWLANAHAQACGTVVQLDDPELGQTWMAGHQVHLSGSPGPMLEPRRLVPDRFPVRS